MKQKFADQPRVVQNMLVGSYFMHAEDRESNTGTVLDIIAALNDTQREVWQIRRQDIVEWFDEMDEEYQIDELTWIVRGIKRLDELEQADQPPQRD